MSDEEKDIEVGLRDEEGKKSGTDILSDLGIKRNG